MGSIANSKRRTTLSRCNEHIRETIAIAHRLMELADEAEAESKDNGCAVLYGIVRDCAYRIRREAQREEEAHKRKGQWEGEL